MRHYLSSSLRSEFGGKLQIQETNNCVSKSDLLSCALLHREQCASLIFSVQKAQGINPTQLTSVIGPRG